MEKLKINNSNGLCEIILIGDWSKSFSKERESLFSLKFKDIASIVIDASGITNWSANFIALILSIKDNSANNKVNFKVKGLPEGATKILTIAESVPERKGAAKKEQKTPFVKVVGDASLAVFDDLNQAITFCGDFIISVMKFLTGLAKFSWKDFTTFLYDCGPSAVPIITLITFLVGLILAFVGAIQLRMFGAQIFVADLVGIGMVRELASIMTAIVMAGRTGAAYAAQLGTMQVNEELDALETMGISKFDFLVLPRMLALILIMPLLCIIADIMGILGGMFVGVFMLDITPIMYYEQTISALRIQDFLIGVFMSVIFGILVSASGCLRGMQCGRSSAAVGTATTSAVVTGIVTIIISTAAITMICDYLGI
jgi:phospholipid/cholesterol/gamma-HCH transport system permease protein